MYNLDTTLIYSSQQLTNFSVNLLVKTGLSEKNAKIIAGTLNFADLRNISSHGIVRLPVYIERLAKKVVNPEANICFEKEEGAVAVLNANNGMGQIAGYKAMKKAIEISNKLGIGLVAAKNSNHFGVASYYSMMASNEGKIGFATTNASPAMAPFGTREPLLGTNPLTIAIPAFDEKPIVLDMAMSTVARGKVRLFAMQNQEVPSDWGLDSEGKTTTDPNRILDGSLLPIGGVKGSAMALIIDILCGVLTGTSLTGEVKNIYDMTGPSNTGHIFISIDISKFIDEDLFKKNIDLVIRKIKALPAVGDNDVFMAGEIEYNLMRKRKEDGIQLQGKLIDLLNKIADKYNVPKL